MFDASVIERGCFLFCFDFSLRGKWQSVDMLDRNGDWFYFRYRVLKRVLNYLRIRFFYYLAI